MGLFDRLLNSLDSNELKSKKSHLKNLYLIAMSDGKLENDEFDFILTVANKLYLNTSVVQSIVQYPEDILFVVPEHNTEKLDQIYDCVCISLIDGEINEREIATCKLIAVKFGFRPIIIDHVIEHIISSLIKGISRELALSKLLNEI